MAAEKFGRYEIIKELGRGGMAAVFLAHDPLIKRDVAIKVMSEKISEDPAFQERFRQEAEVIASLEHPAIVPVYDFGYHDDRAFLVMRHMSGGSMEGMLADGPLNLRQIAPIIERSAEALDEAHRKGIIHRDVKPANILFNARREAMMADFGLAKVMRENTGLTTDGGVVGTADYMAPEQILGDAVDGRVDVYGLGIVLYRALTGELPFHKETVIATAMAHISEPVPQVQDRLPGSRQPWDAILQKALAKKPRDRYPTAGEMAREITSLLSGRWYLNKLLD
ncbi:MAG: serine/threonine protein kinase [Ardenticatenaceae bacterium]|nr:serine/threonine protein kinase [Ardenticatenaceae bacterium]